MGEGLLTDSSGAVSGLIRMSPFLLVQGGYLPQESFIPGFKKKKEG